MLHMVAKNINAKVATCCNRDTYCTSFALPLSIPLVHALYNL